MQNHKIITEEYAKSFLADACPQEEFVLGMLPELLVEFYNTARLVVQSEEMGRMYAENHKGEHDV